MGTTKLENPEDLGFEAADFYGGVLRTLAAGNVPLLVGGGFAFSTYTGIMRDTKDFDLFVMSSDVTRALDLLSQAGYRTENKYPHWLAKAYQGNHVVDLIFNSGNGVCPVDQEWFEHAIDATVLDMPVKLMAVEEMIWQKAFIMERHRFDGADINHMFHARHETIDWDRLIRRFDRHWLVLLSHLLLYRFVYPNDHSAAVNSAIHRLLVRLQTELEITEATENGKAPLCRGTLLSLLEYLPAVQKWGYRDARLLPDGALSAAEVELWTSTFER